MTGKACGAKTSSGGECRKQAGYGTDHLGFGRCKYHCGSTPTGNVSAAKEAAAALGAVMQIDPHSALEQAVGAANGVLLFLQEKVAKLEADDVVSGETMNVWFREYRDSQMYLARIAKYAVDAGVAERHVRAIEQWSGPLAQLLETVLRDRELALTPEQLAAAPKVVGRHLRMLEAPSPEPAAA